MSYTLSASLPLAVTAIRGKTRSPAGLNQCALFNLGHVPNNLR